MNRSGRPLRILVIRRDNIGDLVCTTPLLRALREQLPDAWIAALVTRYNEAVLQGNPDIDALYSYTKAKHRMPGESVLNIYGRRLRTIAELRRQRFDWLLLPGGAQASSLRFARWIAPKHLLVRGDEDVGAGPHEVEQCCHLLTRMGLGYIAPSQRLQPVPAEVAPMRESLSRAWPRRPAQVIGLHISARKPSQRWSAERFAALARRLGGDNDVGFLLLWAPGEQKDPLHPGDDEKADSVLAATHGLMLHPIPTRRLGELIAALSLCDRVICCDGGAMHLAAALGKPIVCLFGQSDPARWRPWGVPHVVLQKPSRDVTDIGVDEVHDAYLRLASEEVPG